MQHAISCLFTKKMSSDSSTKFHTYFVLKKELIRVPVWKNVFFDPYPSSILISTSTVFNSKSVEAGSNIFAILAVKVSDQGVKFSNII